jgi:cytoskeletal protein CcmA (bactofilin family)
VAPLRDGTEEASVFNGAKTTDVKGKKPVPARDASAVTILTSGCHFNGKLYCRGASRIAGKIEGHVISEGLLVIEEDAMIMAEIKADEVVIQGRVQGKLTATTRVELCAASEFTGDITTPVLVVREGALFNGNATMARREEAAARPTPRIVAKGGKDTGKMPEIGTDVKGDPATMKAPEVNVSSN